MALANGMIAGTTNHTGYYPKWEVTLKDGYVRDVKGGGAFGEALKEFLQYPNSNDKVMPFHNQNHPGYWWLYEIAMGTHPKAFRNPRGSRAGECHAERNRSGVFHWGLGVTLHHDPGSPAKSQKLTDFTAQYNLPRDHGWHTHTYFTTYKVRLRNAEPLGHHHRQGTHDEPRQSRGACPGIAVRQPRRVAAGGLASGNARHQPAGRLRRATRRIPWHVIWGDIEKAIGRHLRLLLSEADVDQRPTPPAPVRPATAVDECKRPSMSITSRLLRILGRRAFMTFGLVTFLVSALLATVNLTSRYALKVYVEDQLSRIPWDLAIYQRGGITGRDKLPAAVRTSRRGDRKSRVSCSCARRFPEGGEVTERGGRQASDGAVDVPARGLRHCRSCRRSWPWRSNGAAREMCDNGAVLALVGPERAMGSAFLALQGSKEFSVHVQGMQEKRARLLFSTPLRGVIRLDRDELNRWLMDQTGSVSYVPYIGVVLLMPHNPNVIARFDAVATGIMPLDVLAERRMRTGATSQLAEYEPEMVYLGRLERDRLISGWDITGSLDRVARGQHAVNDAGRCASPCVRRT